MQENQTNWQTMDSAPKDGTRFLAVIRGTQDEVRLVAWTKASHVSIHSWCFVDQGPENADFCSPSLWQPMPSVPEVSNALEEWYGIESASRISEWSDDDIYEEIEKIRVGFIETSKLRKAVREMLYAELDRRYVVIVNLGPSVDV